MRAALLVFLAACLPESPMKIDEMPCPTTGTQLTYASFGQQFMADHCNECHSSSKNGAPGKFKFDSHEQVKDHAERIFIRAAGPNVSMPPGPDDPPESERDQLAEWLACGAP